MKTVIEANDELRAQVQRLTELLTANGIDASTGKVSDKMVEQVETTPTIKAEKKGSSIVVRTLL